MGRKSIILDSSSFGRLFRIDEETNSGRIGKLRRYLKDKGKNLSFGEFEDLWNDWQTGEVDDLHSYEAFRNPEVFWNGWVIHFTNNPFSILRDGFIGFRDENIDYLWRTRTGSFHYDGDGYCFAYDAMDDKNINHDYGDWALLFRVSGLKVKNWGDLGEEQVIFDSGSVNRDQCFLLSLKKRVESSYGGDGEMETSKKVSSVSVVNPVNCRPIYTSDTLRGCIDWVIANHRQYSGANAFKQVGKLRSMENSSHSLAVEIADYCRKVGPVGRYDSLLSGGGKYIELYSERPFGIKRIAELFGLDQVVDNKGRRRYSGNGVSIYQEEDTFNIYATWYNSQVVRDSLHLYNGDSFYKLVINYGKK